MIVAMLEIDLAHARPGQTTRMTGNIAGTPLEEIQIGIGRGVGAIRPSERGIVTGAVMRAQGEEGMIVHEENIDAVIDQETSMMTVYPLLAIIARATTTAYLHHVTTRTVTEMATTKPDPTPLDHQQWT
jgi:hypothetical protein